MLFIGFHFGLSEVIPMFLDVLVVTMMLIFPHACIHQPSIQCLKSWMLGGSTWLA